MIVKNTECEHHSHIRLEAFNVVNKRFFSPRTLASLMKFFLKMSLWNWIASSYFHIIRKLGCDHERCYFFFLRSLASNNHTIICFTLTTKKQQTSSEHSFKGQHIHIETSHCDHTTSFNTHFTHLNKYILLNTYIFCLCVCLFMSLRDKMLSAIEKVCFFRFFLYTRTLSITKYAF